MVLTLSQFVALLLPSLKMPPVALHMVNRIPIGAGLGSSSAAIVAGLLAGLALTGESNRIRQRRHNSVGSIDYLSYHAFLVSCKLSLVSTHAPADTRLPVEREEKALQLAATVEGHVDNLAPCIYGGMQVRFVFVKYTRRETTEDGARSFARP